MTLEKAIKILGIKYGIALTNDYIQKPISWALYQTWKDVNAKEKPRKSRMKGETK